MLPPSLQGTFGQVVSCWSDVLGCTVAVKVIKNQPAYYHQVGLTQGAIGDHTCAPKHVGSQPATAAVRRLLQTNMGQNRAWWLRLGQR